ncbi:vitamin K epoxide reductase family protein [Bryocella elongata]|uniref:vitamin K epoxide reductase family protein n=1 Tax=Bryocella elongata TaxID=863522 RepID=UPI000CDEC7A8|nr:vitamin K epoxide reductase family protein [Bryocella elongata]
MRYLIALLALAGLIDSWMALRIHNQDPAQAPPCAVTANFDCGAVNHSKYAVLPPISFDEDPATSKKVHVPVALLGLIGYALIGVIALLPKVPHRSFVLLQLAEGGFAFAAFLSFLEEYVLQKWCIYCLWSAGFITAIMLVAFASLVVDSRKRRKAGA